MSGFNPVIVNGLVGAATQPVVVAVGSGEPHGNANASQAVAVVVSGFAGCVQLNVVDVDNTADVVTVVGFEQVGAGAQVTLATQPAADTLPSDVNTKVSHCPGPAELIEGGIVAPV